MEQPQTGRAASDPNMLSRRPLGVEANPPTPRWMSLLGRLSRVRRSNSIVPEPVITEGSGQEEQPLREVPFAEQPFQVQSGLQPLVEEPSALSSEAPESASASPVLESQPDSEQTLHAITSARHERSLPPVEHPGSEPQPRHDDSLVDKALVLDRQLSDAPGPTARLPAGQSSLEQPVTEQPLSEQSVAEQPLPEDHLNKGNPEESAASGAGLQRFQKGAAAGQDTLMRTIAPGVNELNVEKMANVQSTIGALDMGMIGILPICIPCLARMLRILCHMGYVFILLPASELQLDVRQYAMSQLEYYS